MPKVSVIIPCYNLGKYIEEAIDSVLKQTFQDFEIIIVNDGSTDSETISILNSLDYAKVNVLEIKNQGLANARNTGIKEAIGKYILPLDADDKIAPTYLEKSVKILDENKNIGIVYCLASFFDEEDCPWDLPEYELPRMLLDNLIFCSAFFRKSDWESVVGYKPIMKYGWEDYEFWLSIIELNRKVHRIPEYLFFYRQRTDSMANLMAMEHLLYSHKEIAKHHANLFINNIEFIFEKIYALKEEIANNQQELINKDTKIHLLNLEKLELNGQIIELNSQLSSVKVLAKTLIKQIFNKIRVGRG